MKRKCATVNVFEACCVERGRMCVHLVAYTVCMGRPGAAQSGVHGRFKDTKEGPTTIGQRRRRSSRTKTDKTSAKRCARVPAGDRGHLVAVPPKRRAMTGCKGHKRQDKATKPNIIGQWAALVCKKAARGCHRGGPERSRHPGDGRRWGKGGDRRRKQRQGRQRRDGTIHDGRQPLSDRCAALGGQGKVGGKRGR